jgi:hypothetical protein
LELGLGESDIVVLLVGEWLKVRSKMSRVTTQRFPTGSLRFTPDASKFFPFVIEKNYRMLFVLILPISLGRMHP